MLAAINRLFPRFFNCPWRDIIRKIKNTYFSFQNFKSYIIIIIIEYIASLSCLIVSLFHSYWCQREFGFPLLFWIPRNLSQSVFVNKWINLQGSAILLPSVKRFHAEASIKRNRWLIWINLMSLIPLSAKIVFVSRVFSVQGSYFEIKHRMITTPLSVYTNKNVRM